MSTVKSLLTMTAFNVSGVVGDVSPVLPNDFSHINIWKTKTYTKWNRVIPRYRSKNTGRSSSTAFDNGCRKSPRPDFLLRYFLWFSVPCTRYPGSVLRSPCGPGAVCSTCVSTTKRSTIHPETRFLCTTDGKFPTPLYRRV